MLKFQASGRLSAEDALHHPYISQTATEKGGSGCGEEGEEGESNSSSVREDDSYNSPDSTPHTSSDNCSQLDISNSSDSGILPDSCPS